MLSGTAELLFLSQKHKPKTFYLHKILKQSIMETASDCRKHYFKINLSCSYMDLVPSLFWHLSFAKCRNTTVISLCCYILEDCKAKSFFVFEFVLDMELFGNYLVTFFFFPDTFLLWCLRKYAVWLPSENHLWRPVPITEIPWEWLWQRDWLLRPACWEEIYWCSF